MNSITQTRILKHLVRRRDLDTHINPSRLSFTPFSPVPLSLCTNSHHHPNSVVVHLDCANAYKLPIGLVALSSVKALKTANPREAVPAAL